MTFTKDAVVDTNNQTMTLAGDISGLGGLNKIGNGQLVLSGNNSFIGPTTVTAGMFTIDGSITSPVTVLPAGTLNGSGSITGNVVIGGTLGPGDSIGTLMVNGSVDFQTGSTFQVEADPTRADNLDVNAAGDIVIASGSTIEVVPTPATYGANMVYQIASTEGSVIGTFSNVVNTFPLINAEIVYRSTPTPSLTSTAAGINEIDLILNFMSLSSQVTSGNAGAIAQSLNGFTPVPGSDMEVVLRQLYFLPNQQALESALNQMQPSILNSLTLAQQNSSLSVSSVFFQHASHLRDISCPCTPAQDKTWRIWGDGGIDWARQGGNHQNVGFHAKTWLGVVGIDYRLVKHLYLGVLGARTETTIDCHHHLAKGNIHATYVGLYSHWLHCSYFANAFVVTSFDGYHSKRAVKFGTIDRSPHGHHPGHSLLSHIDLGVILGKNRRAQVSPYGRLDYLYQREKGYTETKAQSLDNNIRSRSSNMLRTEVGVEGRYCPSKNPSRKTRFLGKNAFTPSGKIGWVRETRFHGKNINARLVDVPNRYHVVGLYPNRSMMIVGASLTVDLYESMTYLSLDYEGLFGSKYRSNAGNVTLNFQF